MIPRPKALSLLVLALVALAACAPRPRPPAAAPPAAAPVASPAATAVPAQAPPAGAQWAKPDATRAQYREDLESCYAYARAQIAHDVRIETDSGAAFDAFPSGLGITELSQGMNQFERRNRQSSLYVECMRAKGYREQ